MAGLFDFIKTPTAQAQDPLAAREKWLNLASIFQGMTINPQTGQQGIQQQLADIRSQRQKDAATKLAEAQRNKTAQWLASQGRTDLAQGILNGSLTGAQAFELFKQQPKDERTAQIKNYEYWIKQGKTPEQAEALARSGQVINVGGGDEFKLPTPPAGYQYFRDTDGVVKMRPTEGGPAAQKQIEAEAKKEAAKATELRTSGIVVEDIGRLRDIIKEQTLLDPVTGPTGSVAAKIPASARVDAEELAKTVKGNIGFDRLQRMRDESPTGGALGAINQQEMELLSTVMGSLNLSQSSQELLFNLDRLEKIYSDIMAKAAAYPNANKYGYGGANAQAEEKIPTWNPSTGKFE